MRRWEHAPGTALVTVADAATAQLLLAWLQVPPRVVFLWGAQVVTHGVFKLRSRR